MITVPFKFPALLVPAPNDSDQWQDQLWVACDDSSFTVGDKKHIKGRFYVGNLIFDSLGRSWRLNDLLTSVLKTGRFWAAYADMCSD